MDLLRVCDRKTERMFLDAAREIYKNDKTWVCLSMQYITYRYLFDRKKEFKRYPIPEVGSA